MSGYYRGMGGWLSERDGLLKKDRLLRERDGWQSERDGWLRERDGWLSERDEWLWERDGWLNWGKLSRVLYAHHCLIVSLHKPATPSNRRNKYDMKLLFSSVNTQKAQETAKTLLLLRVGGGGIFGCFSIILLSLIVSPLLVTGTLNNPRAGSYLTRKHHYTTIPPTIIRRW
jgi:hypothetical protein